LSKNIETNKYTAVEKCLLILSWFSKDCPSMSLNEITEKTKFNITTTYRILQTLIKFGYIARTNDRKYCIGTKPVYLNAIANAGKE
jgi:IclR family KDG regulon transcriptional repressor|tara:strand:- start:531 stop:788 length:258 start_codon:yes stop_codon:yes gene_type:complete